MAPKTTKNFATLCEGSYKDPDSGKVLTYEGSFFHKVIRHVMVQGGDITYGNGIGGQSIYGARFEDENYIFKHNKPYILSMTKEGPHDD